MYMYVALEPTSVSDGFLVSGLVVLASEFTVDLCHCNTSDLV